VTHLVNQIMSPTLVVQNLLSLWTLKCLNLEQPVSSSEEGGSQNIENFFMFSSVCSQLGARHGNTSQWLGSNVTSPWGIRYSAKVSFKNQFSFCCFYILRTVQSRFHHVSLLTSSLDSGGRSYNVRSTTVSLGVRLLTQLTIKQEVIANLSVLEMKASWEQ
jgi:hypothetical protein